MRRIDRTRAGIERKLADFAGNWRLERKISQADGTRAVFLGQADWQPKDDGLLCVEIGVLTLPGQAQMQAERRYFWSEDLSVYFDDGRFFHKVPALGGETGHWCDPDQYDGCYDFGDWPVFRVTWRVKGPKKDYKMISAYERE
ncbi:hypothetical protein PEL8287_01732 [Roseovarius litorisediminis]|uniref:DUF6314 domain-containing protein n=1 Tax=Roseovarius litorisediminis TaxID=1312363 RepID=A0A1Y5SF42_9RHOB|nr:DUF6314 family protein [Roseovarius litorisediminis]SLN36515.1 hypothetical protein PEL8287_01732 [Roseovarius litorisediminis]